MAAPFRRLKGRCICDSPTWEGCTCARDEEFTVKFTYRGRQILRKLPTRDAREAAKLARQIRTTLRTEQAQQLFQALEGMKRRNTYATVQQVFTAYQGGPRPTDKRELITWKTRRRNINNLTLILTQALPGNPLHHSCAVLTHDLCMEWMALRQQYYTLIQSAEELEEDGDLEEARALRDQATPDALRAAGPWRKRLTLGRHPANTTIRSMLRQANDIFSNDSRKIRLHDITLPDLEPWVTVPKPEPMPTGYIPLAQSIISQMHQDASDLQRTHLKLWITNRLVSLHALRAGEVAGARGSWLVHDEKGWALDVRDRPEEGFYLKSASHRLIPLDPELASVIKATPRDAYLIQALHKTEAHDLVNREHNAWLRRYIPDRVKCNHELRKHVGSVILTQHGIEIARQYLGHKSQSTTEKWYATLLKDMPTMTSHSMNLPAMRSGKAA